MTCLKHSTAWGSNPLGAACASAKCTEHRTVRAKKDDDKAEAAETVRRSIVQPASDVSEDEAASRLVPGDRIVIKYLDDQKARPECYVIAPSYIFPLNAKPRRPHEARRLGGAATPGSRPRAKRVHRVGH